MLPEFGRPVLVNWLVAHLELPCLVFVDFAFANGRLQVYLLLLAQATDEVLPLGVTCEEIVKDCPSSEVIYQYYVLVLVVFDLAAFAEASYFAEAWRLAVTTWASLFDFAWRCLIVMFEKAYRLASGLESDDSLRQPQLLGPWPRLHRCCYLCLHSTL